MVAQSLLTCLLISATVSAPAVAGPALTRTDSGVRAQERREWQALRQAAGEMMSPDAIAEARRQAHEWAQPSILGTSSPTEHAAANFPSAVGRSPQTARRRRTGRRGNSRAALASHSTAMQCGIFGTAREIPRRLPGAVAASP